MTSQIPEVPLESELDAALDKANGVTLTSKSPAFTNRLRAAVAGVRDILVANGLDVALPTHVKTFITSTTTQAARAAINAQVSGTYATLTNGKVPAEQLPTMSGGTPTTSASELTSGTLPVGRLAGGHLLVITKALTETSPGGHSAGSWPTTRPTLPSGVRIMFVGDTDPALVPGLRADGDLWARA